MVEYGLQGKHQNEKKSETQVCNWYSCDYGWATRNWGGKQETTVKHR
jgi:hypothetical protein